MSQQTANPACSISPRCAPAIHTRFAHAIEALIAIAVPTAIIAAAVLLIFAIGEVRVPSIRFTGASLTVQFGPPAH